MPEDVGMALIYNRQGEIGGETSVKTVHVRNLICCACLAATFIVKVLAQRPSPPPVASRVIAGVADFLDQRRIDPHWRTAGHQLGTRPHGRVQPIW